MADENNSSSDLAGSSPVESEGDLSKLNVSSDSCALTAYSNDITDSCDELEMSCVHTENQDSFVVASYKENSTISFESDSNSTSTAELPTEMGNLCTLFVIRTVEVFSGGILPFCLCCNCEINYLLNIMK